MGDFRCYVFSETDRNVSIKAHEAFASARSADLAPILAEMQAKGVTSFNGLAGALTEAGIHGAGRLDVEPGPGSTGA